MINALRAWEKQVSVSLAGTFVYKSAFLWGQAGNPTKVFFVSFLPCWNIVCVCVCDIWGVAASQTIICLKANPDPQKKIA